MTTSIFLIALGIIYIIYSVINKDKIFINNKENYIILDKENLQLFTIIYKYFVFPNINRIWNF